MAVPTTTPRDPATIAPTTGRGRGRGRGRPSRGRGQGQRRQQQTHKQASSFKGNTDDMNGHVFQCKKESQDKQEYLKTVEALGEYISKTLDYPRDKLVFHVMPCF